MTYNDHATLIYLCHDILVKEEDVINVILNENKDIRHK